MRTYTNKNSPRRHRASSERLMYVQFTSFVYGVAFLIRQSDVIRSSHHMCSMEKGVLRNFAKFTGNICARASFLIKFFLILQFYSNKDIELAIPASVVLELCILYSKKKKKNEFNSCENKFTQIIRYLLRQVHTPKNPKFASTKINPREN